MSAPPIAQFLDGLTFEEEVEVTMELYGLPEEQARLHAAIRRGLVDGDVQETTT